ncbi:MAG: hypothetical protein H7A38_00125 [Chlamydiales bacterium]|nr:hypothetical protein [Chlamydiales bacterium]
MIKHLFGNQNIEHVLFFLFVNEKCYGAQLQTLLNLPLTPIQRALSHLEKNGIICSTLIGKKRLYEFNSIHPLRWEIESLLKKAYTLLPPERKKLYCYIHRQRLSAKQEWKRKQRQTKNLSSFWERLLRVNTLSAHVTTRTESQKIDRKGKATVWITMPSQRKIVFQEKGTWLSNGKPHTQFRNTFQWSLDVEASLITLEHLRYGLGHPVFLFHLTPVNTHQLESVDAHLCGDDVYLGNISWNANTLLFHWRVIGPNKNEELTYSYT